MSTPKRLKLSPKDRHASVPGGSDYEAPLPIFTYQTHISPTGQIPKIHHCYDKEQWEIALEYLLHESVLGFDCEWKPDEIYPETILTPEIGRVFDEFRGLPMVRGEGVMWLPNASSRSDFSGDVLRLPSTCLSTASVLQHGYVQNGINSGDNPQFSKPNNMIIDDHGQAMHLIKEKCSVLQLGSETHIVVAHIARFKTQANNPSQLIPEILRYILGSSKIIKTGLEVFQDGNLCETQRGVKVHGLRCLRVLHDSLSDQKFKGMGGLAARYLRKRMTGKGDRRRQLSDWSLPYPLTEEQIEYAANDALISLLIHNELLDQILTNNDAKSTQVLQETMSSTSPSPFLPTPIPASIKSEKAKLARERKHRANFLTLPTPSKILYGNLCSLRDKLMHKAGLFEATQSRFVADTETLFLLAREKPVTIEELKNLGRKVQKATREEYCYYFVNLVREYLGLVRLQEPETFSAYWAEERRMKRVEKEIRGEEEKLRRGEIIKRNIEVVRRWEVCDPRRARRWRRLNQEMAERYGLLSTAKDEEGERESWLLQSYN